MPGGWQEGGLGLAGGTMMSLVADTTGAGVDDEDSGNGAGCSEATLPSQSLASTWSLFRWPRQKWGVVDQDS
jgi:hypothetical protein